MRSVYKISAIENERKIFIKLLLQAKKEILKLSKK